YRLVDNGVEGELTRIEIRNTGAGFVTDSIALIEDLATTANEGLRFRFWDTAQVAIPSGSLAANLNNIGRIQFKVRGIMVGGQSGNQRMFSDSLVTSIQLRGNQRLH
ncbi:MAG TPA: hypothetical protein VK864_04580, partial [Longimicrobiales bacterium]|nr:hypothetical protein [Longimicrobiales bacterium]